MKTEELFLSTEQCEHLQELGLDMSDAVFCWYGLPYDRIVWQITTIVGRMREEMKRNSYRNLIPTYTLQEVLDKLPESIKIGGSASNLLYTDYADCRLWYETYRFSTKRIVDINGDTFLEAAYKMICWVLENGYYKPLQNVTH